MPKCIICFNLMTPAKTNRNFCKISHPSCAKRFRLRISRNMKMKWSFIGQFHSILSVGYALKDGGAFN